MALSKEERRIKKEVERRGKIVYKTRRYNYANWILKLEYSLFGYVYAGNEINEIDDGYSGTVSDSGTVTIRHKSHIVKYAYFARPKCYPSNFLFGLTAFISRILSQIRVITISATPGIVIAAVLLAWLAGETGQQVAIGLGIGYVSTIVASILVALLGFLWRKVFRLDEKCDQMMEEAGYVAWGDNKDDYKDQF